MEGATDNEQREDQCRRRQHRVEQSGQIALDLLQRTPRRSEQPGQIVGVYVPDQTGDAETEDNGGVPADRTQDPPGP